MGKGGINQYICQTCGGVITTIDRDDGTTSFMLDCRVTPGCPGRMQSAVYLVDQTLTPNWEWYMPEKLPKERSMRQHVRMGGLLIRKIEK